MLLLQSHSERFATAMAAIMFYAILLSIIYTGIMVLVAIYSAAMKVMGKPYIVLAMNPIKWRIIRDSPDQKQDDEYTYGKYLHTFADGGQHVYLARKHYDGVVEFHDGSQWLKVADNKKHNFVPDKIESI